MQLVCQTKGGGIQECPITITSDGGLQASDVARFEILMPKIEVAMTGPKLRYLDRHAVYSLKISNPGNAPASKVEVHQAIPSGFKFHQASAGGQFNEASRIVSWSLGELPAGQTKEIAVDLVPVAAGDHQLTALAKAGKGLTSQADVRTTVEGLPSISFEVSHVDDPLEVGAETAFQIRVVNTGTKAETNVELVCTLPEQLEYRGAKASTALKCRQEGREVIFEPLAHLGPKCEATYRVQVRGASPGDVRFRTRLKSDGLRVPVVREESIRVYSDGEPVRTTTVAPPIPSSKDGGAPPIPAPTPPVSAPESGGPPTVPLPTVPMVPSLPSLPRP
jgi:uncharacterized repeat protein (TIGR01451 family)